MISPIDQYVIEGKAHMSPEHEAIPLGEINVTEDRVEVVLISGVLGRVSCDCRIWEHTIFELENVAAALRLAAAGEFPPPFPAETPDSQIGTNTILRFATCLEVGLRLEEPGQEPATFFCFSRQFGRPRDRAFGVLIGLAVGGGYGEVVVEPAHAVQLADWLDLKVKEMWED